MQKFGLYKGLMEFVWEQHNDAKQCVLHETLYIYIGEVSYASRTEDLTRRIRTLPMINEGG